MEAFDRLSLPAGQARPLLAIPDKGRQIEIAERAVAEGLTARELEKLKKNYVTPYKRRKAKRARQAAAAADAGVPGGDVGDDDGDDD